jgi:tetratricopeptide (TPR) repeat protein
MMDSERVLQPLREQAAAVEKLQTYASAGELAGAIASVRAALDRSVRLMLRADDGAPEEARVKALSPGMSLDAVITSLRRRDRVSMELAGRLHEVEGIAGRLGGGGEVRAVDADVVLSAVRLLHREVTSHPVDEPPVALHAAPDPVASPGWESPSDATVGSGGRRVILLVALVAAVAAVFLLTRGSTDSREEAVAAFEAGDLGAARRGFEEALGQDSADVTALLYLARIHRREERPGDAAAALRVAADLASEDADVRRELGWLFLDLGRPAAAVEQFERARTAEPADSRNWIGLVQALRAANDPRAAQVLRDAPADVRAALGGAGS